MVAFSGIYKNTYPFECYSHEVKKFIKVNTAWKD